MPFQRAWLEAQVSELGLLEEWMREWEVLEERVRQVGTSDPDSLGVEAEGVDFLLCMREISISIQPPLVIRIFTGADEFGVLLQPHPHPQ